MLLSSPEVVLTTVTVCTAAGEDEFATTGDWKAVVVIYTVSYSTATLPLGASVISA